MTKKTALEFDVHGCVEIDGKIVQGTGDYFTVRIHGTLHTNVKQDAIFVQKLGEAHVLAQIDGTKLLQDMEISDVAEIVASRFGNADDMELLIESLRGLV